MSKKVRDVLKGVAITGAAVGGASVLQDADLVYAMEAEETLEDVAKGELTVNIEHAEKSEMQQETQLTAEQTEINEAIAAENTAIAEAQAAESEIDEQITDKNSQISSNQSAIEEKNDIIADIDGQIEQKDAEITEATTQIAETKENLIAASANKTEAESELGVLTSDLVEDKALLTEKEELEATSGYNKAGAGIIAAKFDELLDTASEQIINMK